MFTTGLRYFMSLYDNSDTKDTSDEAKLPTTADMELIVYGVRPFVKASWWDTFGLEPGLTEHKLFKYISAIRYQYVHLYSWFNGETSKVTYWLLSNFTEEAKNCKEHTFLQISYYFFMFFLKIFYSYKSIKKKILLFILLL